LDHVPAQPPRKAAHSFGTAAEAGSIFGKSDAGTAMGAVATHAESSAISANTSSDLKSTGEEAAWEGMVGPNNKVLIWLLGCSTEGTTQFQTK
jgi:hypothetical protein